jgi:hypothetical protein
MKDYHFVVGDTPYVIQAATLKEALAKLRELTNAHAVP